MIFINIEPHKNWRWKSKNFGLISFYLIGISRAYPLCVYVFYACSINGKHHGIVLRSPLAQLSMPFYFNWFSMWIDFISVTKNTPKLVQIFQVLLILGPDERFTFLPNIVFHRANARNCKAEKWDRFVFNTLSVCFQHSVHSSRETPEHEQRKGFATQLETTSKFFNKKKPEDISFWCCIKWENWTPKFLVWMLAEQQHWAKPKLDTDFRNRNPCSNGVCCSFWFSCAHCYLRTQTTIQS